MKKTSSAGANQPYPRSSHERQPYLALTHAMYAGDVTRCIVGAEQVGGDESAQVLGADGMEG